MCFHLHIYKGNLMGCQLYVVLWPCKDVPGCQLCLTEWTSPVDYLPEDVIPKVVCLALGGSSVEVICGQTHVSNSHEPGCCNDYELYLCHIKHVPMEWIATLPASNSLAMSPS